MHHALIVARMAPGSAPAIADVFADSDRGELPHLVGVARRSLFQFGDVYLHLIESEQDPAPQVARLAGHPEFRGVSERLGVRQRVRPDDLAQPQGRHGALLLPLGAGRRLLSREPGETRGRPPRDRRGAGGLGFPGGRISRARCTRRRGGTR